MPKTNAECAAHLIQAYIDSDNGKNANADVQYIQSMKTSLDEKFQKLQNEDRRAPLPFMTMKTRYSELDEMEVGTPLNSIVQTQIDKTNQTRGVNQTNGSFVTKDLIAKEGKEKLADFEKRLGLNTEFNDGMDLGHEPGPLF